MKHRVPILLAALLLLVFRFVPAQSQEQDEEELTIGLNKEFGYAWGSEIQGTFSIEAEGSQDLDRVEFLIDSQPLGEVDQPPFRIRFDTGNYEYGNHTLNAVGYTQDGRMLPSQTILIEFVPPDQGMQAAFKIVLPLLALILAAILLSAAVPLLFGGSKQKDLPPGAPRSYGLVGGTICPKCNRPFGMHIYGLNLLAGKLDRCPYCGRWSLVRRVSPQQLAAAEAAELGMVAGDSQLDTLSEEEKLRKSLEDSRYLDM